MSEKIYIYEVMWQIEPILQVRAENRCVSKEACYYPKFYEKTFEMRFQRERCYYLTFGYGGG